MVHAVPLYCCLLIDGHIHTELSISILGAMCYIELACVVPLSGGETVYLKAAFGDFVSFVFSWLRAVVLGPTG